METNWKIAAVAAALLTLVGCTGPGVSNTKPAAEYASRPRNITLYSWQIAPGEYRFALVPYGNEEDFVRGFSQTKAALRGIGELESALLKVLPDAVIYWTDEPSRGLRYPPDGVVDIIEKFALRNGIRLRLYPSAV